MPAMLYACCLPRVAEGNRARIESTNINRLVMKTVYKDLNFKHQNSSERLHGGGAMPQAAKYHQQAFKPSSMALERQNLFTKALANSYSEVFGRLQAAFEVEKV